MEVVPLNDDDVRTLSANVDTEMRAYCSGRSGDDHWIENFMRKCAKKSDFAASPLPAEDLWQMIVDHLGRPTLQ